MNHVAPDRFNVAWFKLAEFVSRGEKERAFGMLRLLMHSIENRALEHQLKGDIYLSFEDELALESYRYAAELYTQQAEPKKAIALYEQIITLSPPTHLKLLEKVTDLYESLLPIERETLYVRRFIPLLIDTKLYEQAELFLSRVTNHQPTDEYLALLQKFTLAIIASPEHDATKKQNYSCTLLDQLIFSSSTLLPTFLIQLEALHPDLHAFTHRYLINQGESNDLKTSPNP